MSNVSGVNGANQTYAPQNTGAAKYQAKPKSEKEAPKETEAATFEKSKETQETKKTYKPDTQTISALKAAADQQTQALRAMVEKLLTNQGLTARDVLEAYNSGKTLNVPVDQATRDEAAALVAEDGELGWKKVSENILNFAKALSGGDPSKIDMLRKAVEKGFKAAEKILGEFPDVSKKTYEAVMKGFDDWAAESAPKVSEE